MSVEVKNKKKVNLRKSEEQLEAKQSRLLQKKKKKVIRIVLISTVFLFCVISMILIATGSVISEYNMFFDYIFKLICVLLNAL